MIEFFHTKDRLRFLLFVGAIAVPILLIAAWVVTTMENSAARNGEPNAEGGLHYRIEESGGADVLPEALADLLTIPPNTLMTDVSADTDETGRLLTASIKAFSTDDFAVIGAFYRPLLSPVTSDTASELWGIRDGYEIKISHETEFFENDPYKDRTKVEFYIGPVKDQ